jgi:Tfp pilus assembly protein PilO
MKGTDRIVLLVLPVIALLAAFWFLILSPKREEAASLEDDVAALQASVEEQEQVAAAAEAARETFPANYRRMVVLGKAVPEDSDTSSLLVELSTLATATQVEFTSLELVEGAAAPAPPPATEPTTPAGAAEQSEQAVASAEAGAAPVVPTATESSVANLPIGATVGPAALPVMPYSLRFGGDFFAIANFISKMDRLVGLHKDDSPKVYGRLLTVDGFVIKVPDEFAATALATIPVLDAEFAVTTFITPPGEGLTAGASPTGPAPAEPQPTAAESAAPAAPPAATVGAAP